ncbi:hypothetical protein BC834DRAFT_192254 [Gloeopeniophorella convolvens]|nr:hypothetical protein BC834DRAFT_192254 [Gloeopeniophorella convolvens]
MADPFTPRDLAGGPGDHCWVALFLRLGLGVRAFLQTAGFLVLHAALSYRLSVEPDNRVHRLYCVQVQRLRRHRPNTPASVEGAIAGQFPCNSPRFAVDSSKSQHHSNEAGHMGVSGHRAGPFNHLLDGIVLSLDGSSLYQVIPGKDKFIE